MKEGFVYLATPYSHPDAFVREQRHREAAQFLAWCLFNGIWAYSPIVHTAAVANGLPYTYEFWHPYNCAMIRASRGLYVLRIDGWEKSAGIAAEIAFAKEIGLPVTFFDKEGNLSYVSAVENAEKTA
jgi:hypothetical protein